MRKAVLTPALLVTCLLAITGCGDDGGDPTVAAPPTQVTSEPAPTSTIPSAAVPSTGAPTTAPAAPSRTPAVRQLVITVEDGRPSGDTGLVELDVDEPFQVRVTSDAADEVHVHTETRAGVSAQVAAGGTVTLDAVIGAPGRYEVELEGSRVLLARLQVS